MTFVASSVAGLFFLGWDFYSDLVLGLRGK
jgi:hypothetical protein